MDEPERAVVLQRLGLPDEAVTEVAWADLDRSVEPDHLTSVFVPEVGAPVAAELVRFDRLVHELRQRCPWDREQTHHSLTRYVLEEAQEAGAHGIIGVVDTNRHLGDLGVTEFHITGTAVVVEGAGQVATEATPEELARLVAVRELSGEPRKEAIAGVAQELGVPKRDVYAAVVAARPPLA